MIIYEKMLINLYFFLLSFQVCITFKLIDYLGIRQNKIFINIILETMKLEMRLKGGE